MDCKLLREIERGEESLVLKMVNHSRVALRAPFVAATAGNTKQNKSAASPRKCEIERVKRAFQVKNLRWRILPAQSGETS